MPPASIYIYTSGYQQRVTPTGNTQGAGLLSKLNEARDTRINYVSYIEKRMEFIYPFFHL